MPAVSKSQFKFMQAIKNGNIVKPDLSPQQASEFVDTTSYKSLPEQIGHKKRFGRLSNYMKGIK